MLQFSKFCEQLQVDTFCSFVSNVCVKSETKIKKKIDRFEGDRLP